MRAPLAGRLERPMRRVLPRTLLGRSLLIILVPLLVTEGIALQLFYGSHLNIVSRRLSGAVAGEIAYTLDLLDAATSAGERDRIIASADRHFELAMRFEPGAHLRFRHTRNILGPMDDDMAAALREAVGRPFTMDWTSDPREVLLRIEASGGVLAVNAPRKRLDTGTIYYFMAWLVGSSLLLFLIAALFMRNQVRSIRRLSRAAEAFGMGREAGPIKPEGAQEVRKAAFAFNRMQERILRFVTQRTEMLAGVSHDLRTPLTRLRLSLAMLPVAAAASDGAADGPGDGGGDVAGMVADVEEMERMIEAYLAFARGEGEERRQRINLASLVEEVASRARRSGAEIVCAVDGPVPVELRPDAMRRALTNLVDNARRHAGHVRLALQVQTRQVQVLVDDDGPGIPLDRRESVFRPFETGAHGGTGLGLTIARDIVRAHGGDIVLEASPLGGLRARVRIPF